MKIHLEPGILARLDVLKAKILFRQRHPEIKAALARLERQPSTIYLTLPADVAGDET